MPKLKRGMGRAATFLGYDSPKEMGLKLLIKALDVAEEVFINSTEEKPVVRDKKRPGRNLNSDLSLFDKKENVKTSNDANDVKNTTSERVRNNNVTHASPSEHIVKAHKQYYNTREGRVLIEKEAFPRGRKDKSM